MSHKSGMAGPFNSGDTIINKHFTFYLFILVEGLNRFNGADLTLNSDVDQDT